ncbi:MAG: bifunctional [glutamate--ammonia ligase]-adenylyl-L-tyrosine phosphorylase/[glutamate--ammonia-ligase] adenylyltransferase [Myxococcales bacterium]|nr:bifunctional [glutamate--ammonia ligase]-adenylyl-L-tyrosine phosphorylase/[glutamate--ammonia-ligase] adenylyltransferase [Myxococcales bacterium]
MRDLAAHVLKDAPDESDAARRFERFTDAAEFEQLSLSQLQEDDILLLRLCCQRAPYLATLLARDPQRLIRVGADVYLRRAKGAAVMREELGQMWENIDEARDFDRALRVYRADELLRLGVREMELGTPLEVGEELSALADECLHAAIDFHGTRLREQYGQPLQEDECGEQVSASLVVMGMGKLGGQELNFSSDIDLIYIYSSDDGSAGELSLQEFYTKLCRAVSSSIGDVTSEDCVFRVDLRLRPEGSRGTIANSLSSAERYYESFGRPWERQAWLKARPCAGDETLGEDVMKMMHPFVYPRNVSPKVIEQVRGLNQQIKSELGPGAIDGGYDLKNGLGGIREIEFFVQTLQLIHAGRRPKLQTQSTIVALNELLFSGLVSEDERHGLAEAYRYLRHLEHMIQLESGRQTQRLPIGERELRLLALRTQHTSELDLQTQLQAHTEFVHKSFETLGDEEPAPRIEIRDLLRGHKTAERERELLSCLGFRNVQQAWYDLDIARNKPLSPFGGAGSSVAQSVAPLLLTEISRSPDPDQALRHTGELIGRRGSWSPIWAMMHENPDLLRLIASVFGTSEYLSKSFINHPELVDVLRIAGRAQELYTPSELEKSLAKRDIDSTQDREEQWSKLAEFKNSHVLRIGLADIAGALTPEEVCRQLSDVADLCVRRAYALVESDLCERYGTTYDEEGNEIAMAVLAMGKLGGRELGYSSDLDIVFVFSARGESDGKKEIDATTYYSRISQRLMRGLHSLHPGGRLYEIDTRLRPSGSQGLLVSSLAAWRRYHNQSAALWEKQSLTKLRFIAGDAELGRLAQDSASSCIYGEDETDAIAIAEGISTMRDKIWRELVAPKKRLDLKAGHGGIIDIEFAAQYLQLVHGGLHRELQTTSTVLALSAAAQLGLADDETCRILIDGYSFLRRLEHRLRIVHDRSEQHLPKDAVELEKLARRAGYNDGEQLIADFQMWSEELHAAYRTILGLR